MTKEEILKSKQGGFELFPNSSKEDREIGEHIIYMAMQEYADQELKQALGITAMEDTPIVIPAIIESRFEFEGGRKYILYGSATGGINLFEADDKWETISAAPVQYHPPEELDMLGINWIDFHIRYRRNQKKVFIEEGSTDLSKIDAKSDQ